jgi:hypothetical protein
MVLEHSQDLQLQNITQVSQVIFDINIIVKMIFIPQGPL